jgi:hypothetical protein
MPKSIYYKQLMELVNHLDVWIFEWGSGLVVLAYLKETQKRANIGRRKGAYFFLPMNKVQRNKKQVFFLPSLSHPADHSANIFHLRYSLFK